MKTTLLVICLLTASAAFAQYSGAGYISNQPQIIQVPSHPEHASFASMAQEQSVAGGGNYLSAQGDRPASDFPQPPALSLGEIARKLKKEHDTAQKSKVVWINQ